MMELTLVIGNDIVGRIHYLNGVENTLEALGNEYHRSANCGIDINNYKHKTKPFYLIVDSLILNEGETLENIILNLNEKCAGLYISCNNIDNVKKLPRNTNLSLVRISKQYLNSDDVVISETSSDTNGTETYSKEELAVEIVKSLVKQ